MSELRKIISLIFITVFTLQGSYAILLQNRLVDVIGIEETRGEEEEEGEEVSENNLKQGKKGESSGDGDDGNDGCIPVEYSFSLIHEIVFFAGHLVTANQTVYFSHEPLYILFNKLKIHC